MRRPPKKRLVTKRGLPKHQYSHYFDDGNGKCTGALVESKAWKSLDGKVDAAGVKLRARIHQADSTDRAFRIDKPNPCSEWARVQCPRCKGHRVAWVDSAGIAARERVRDARFGAEKVKRETVLVRECQDCLEWRAFMQVANPVRRR